MASKNDDGTGAGSLAGASAERRSYVVHKGHLTRLCASTAALLAGLDTSRPTPATVAEKARRQLDKLESKAEEIVAAEPARLDSYQRDMDAAQLEWDKLAPDVARAVAKVAAVASAGGSGGSAPKAKAVSDLKPFELEMTDSPVKLAQWLQQYRTYHEASNFDDLPVSQQQGYFFKVLHPELAGILREKISGTTPVLGAAGSCESTLKAEFLVPHPLVHRGNDWMQARRGTSESIARWYGRFKQLASEADVRNMSYEDMMILGVVNNVNDKELVNKILNLENVNMGKMERELARYEASQKAVAPVSGGDSLEVAAVAQKTQKPKICFKCGAPFPHPEGRCPHRSSKCGYCKKKGHTEEMCRTKKAGKPPVTEVQHQAEEVAEAAFVDAVSDSVGVRVVALKYAHDSKLVISVPTLLDTGAAKTVIAHRVAKSWAKHFRPATGALRAANGGDIPMCGTVRVTINDGDRSTTCEAWVARGLSREAILGVDEMRALGYVTRKFVDACGCNISMRDELINQYPDVFQDKLMHRAMSGTPMSVELDDLKGLKPLKVLTVRQTPLHMQEMGRQLIADLVGCGILRKVTEPTDWVSPAKFVLKPGGKKVRLVTDYRRLNKYVKRPVHPFPSPTDVIRMLEPGTQVFAKLDAIHGYYQVPLDEKSQLLTTFLLPDGKYCYTGAPMGLSSSGDEFCARTDEAFSGLSFVSKIVDDILVQAPNEEILRSRVVQILDRCQKFGITLSKAKFDVGKRVTFAGHVFTPEGVRPEPAKVDALTKFPPPTNVSELRSFLGMANQFGKFFPELTGLISPLQELLKKEVAYLWTADLQECFERAKKFLTSDRVVRPFIRGASTQLVTDASKLNGLGYILLQRHNEEYRVVQCGSRKLTSCERNYASVELECRGLVWAITECAFYLTGAQFTAVTDHKPLLGLFAKHLTELPNERVRRDMEKVADFRFELEWCPGKDNVIADALSRAPVETEGVFPTTNEVALDSADPALQPLFDAAHSNDYVKLVDLVKEGKQRDPEARPYTDVWDRIEIRTFPQGRLLFVDDRIVVPRGARELVLKLLHKAHAGITKTTLHAKEHFYWPGMNNDVVQTVGRCEACTSLRPKQCEPELYTEDATYPFEKVSSDLFELDGRHYLVVVDRFSGYIFVKELKSLGTKAVTNFLEDLMVMFGRPKSIRTDNGPQYRGDFQAFCAARCIIHETSSPYHPRGNGLAEAAVKSAKFLLKKCHATREVFRDALLALMNMPRSDGFSPAELFLGRSLRTGLPGLSPAQNHLYDVYQERVQRMKAAHDKYKPTARLSGLSLGDSVAVWSPSGKHWSARGC